MQNEFAQNLHHRAEESRPHVYDDLTLDGSRREGRIYEGDQRRIAVEGMILAQERSVQNTEPPMLGDPEEGNISLRSLEWVFTFVRDLK